MNKVTFSIGCLAVAGLAFGQHAHDNGGCDCPSCAESGAATFTLPGLAGLNELVSHEEEHGQHNDHAGHDHVEAEEPHVEDAHDHICEGHGHETGGGLDLPEKVEEKIGLVIHVATGGPVFQSVVFPAEIKLNRDQTAAVSPRYPSVIRQVFAEIGDHVKKGDILASLENRETMAVYTVSAPLDGYVVKKSASVGETAGEDRVLFEVADLSTVWADISVFPKYQHWIKKGMEVEFAAPDGHTAQGLVQYVSPLMSHETRTFTARCVLEGAREDFTPGAFVRARMVVGSTRVPVRVEREAVQVINGQAVVFIQDEHGFETRDVVVGETGDRFVEIKQGLAVGEQYVAKGAFTLKAEMITSGMDPHAGHGH